MGNKKLTDKQIKKIISEHIEGASYNSLSKKYKISVNTVKKYCLSDEEFAQNCKQKKEENAKSILAHMDEKKDVVCEIIDNYLKTLADPERLKKSSTREIATALGIIIDKFTKNGAEAESNKSEEKQENLLKAIEEAVIGGDK